MAKLWVMTMSSGYWFPLAASSEVGERPVSLTRRGKQLVFWRRGTEIVCMQDRCPHRGAALSLGKINTEAGTLRCPFHGLEFGADGHCARVPVETDQSVCADYSVPSLTVTEGNGFIWLWCGEVSEVMPSVPAHPALEGLKFGQSTTVWPAHYTRCIENVCDYSHLPFVHRRTIGRAKRSTVVDLEMEDVPGGFRAYLMNDGKRGQYFEFLYPNMWLLMLRNNLMSCAVFAPIDDHQTAVYGRIFYRKDFPGMQSLMNLLSYISNYIVFREDWPIVGSQWPGDVMQAQHEKLLPSDAPVIAYRKLHHKYAQA